MKLGGDKRGYLPVKILNVPLDGLLDSGASRTIVGEEGWKTMQDAGFCLNRPTKFRYILVANQGTAEICGEAFIPFTVGDITKVVRVLYVPRLSSKLILGLDFWRRFHLRPDFVDNTIEVTEVKIGFREPTAQEDSEDEKK